MKDSHFRPLVFLLALVCLFAPGGEVCAQFILQMVGHTNDGGYAEGVAIAGNYLYLANGNDGLRIYDVSDPTHPVSLAHTNNGGYAHAVAVSGNYACLANDTDGLRLYDISDPANPVSLGANSTLGTVQGVPFRAVLPSQFVQPMVWASSQFLGLL